MRNILYIITTLFSFIVNSQETVTIPLNGVPPDYTPGQIIYYKDTNSILNRYLGDWVYDDGTHYLKITFTKMSHVPCCRNKIYSDELDGKFLYKINGVTIYDTYGFTPRYIQGSRKAHRKVNNVIQFINGISLSYTEPPTNGGCKRARFGDLILEYLSPASLGMPAQLKWSRTDDVMEISDYTCTNGTLMDTTPFQIPANIVLNKQ